MEIALIQGELGAIESGARQSSNPRVTIVPSRGPLRQATLQARAVFHRRCVCVRCVRLLRDRFFGRCRSLDLLFLDDSEVFS